jgi:hypothetical protein
MQQNMSECRKSMSLQAQCPGHQIESTVGEGHEVKVTYSTGYSSDKSQKNQTKEWPPLTSNSTE